jgi:cytoskeletal protein CcmA (bactofilin family)
VGYVLALQTTISGGNQVNESEFPTVIGPDAKFKGELSFESGVKILGSFEGRISTKGNLIVAQEGVIQADIEAGTVTVEGQISGNVAANELVELKSTARLQGDLRCERLIVTDGASFIGHCNVGNGAANEKTPTEPRKPAVPKPLTIRPKTQIDDNVKSAHSPIE